MTGEEIIVTFKEPWYNDYTRRLYTQLSEQMIREEIERVHKEPIITNAVIVRSSNGTYERKPIGFSSCVVYNIPGKAFYAVAGGTGKIAEMQYNDDKTSLGSINLLSIDYLGAGPFEVSDQYFHTVTTSSVNVYEKIKQTSLLGGSDYSPTLTNGLVSSGSPHS